MHKTTEIMEKQLTTEQAIELAKSGIWKEWTDEQIVRFQLFQTKLCMDFSRFHEAMGKVLDRPVFTHEFADQESLIKEYLGTKPPPTFEEIIDMIPKDKLIMLKL